MNDKIIDIAIDNLEQKAIKTSLVNIALTAQGYVVNKAKKAKLEWSSILIHAFENYILFDETEQKNIEFMYNKVFNDGRA